MTMTLTLARSLWAALETFQQDCAQKNLSSLSATLSTLTSAAHEAGPAFRVLHKGKSLQLSTQCQIFKNRLIALKAVVDDPDMDALSVATIVTRQLSDLSEICALFSAALLTKYGQTVKTPLKKAPPKEAAHAHKPKLFSDMREAFSAAAKDLAIEDWANKPEEALAGDGSNFTFDFEGLSESCRESLDAVHSRCMDDGEHIVALTSPLVVVFNGSVPNLVKVPHMKVASSVILPNCLLAAFVLPRSAAALDSERQKTARHILKKCPDAMDILDEEGGGHSNYLKARGYSSLGFLWFMPKAQHTLLSPFTLRSVGFPL